MHASIRGRISRLHARVAAACVGDPPRCNRRCTRDAHDVRRARVCSWLTVGILARQTGNQRGRYSANIAATLSPTCLSFSRPRLAPLLNSRLQVSAGARIHAACHAVRPRAERMDLGEKEGTSKVDGDCARLCVAVRLFHCSMIDCVDSSKTEGETWTFRAREPRTVMHFSFLIYFAKQTRIYLRCMTEINTTVGNRTFLWNSDSRGMRFSCIYWIKSDSKFFVIFCLDDCHSRWHLSAPYINLFKSRLWSEIIIQICDLIKLE